MLDLQAVASGMSPGEIILAGFEVVVLAAVVWSIKRQEKAERHGRETELRYDTMLRRVEVEDREGRAELHQRIDRVLSEMGSKAELAAERYMGNTVRLDAVREDLIALALKLDASNTKTEQIGSKIAAQFQLTMDTIKDLLVEKVDMVRSDVEKLQNRERR